MDIGIGIPNSVRGTTGSQLLDWARKAEAAGFHGLATIGAVEYPSYEELTVFAAAGAVTEQIRFLTNVLISPARSAAELAKQAATVDQLTNGRLTLGLGVGWRATDYELVDRDFRQRGKLFDRQLRDLQRAWAGEPLGEGMRPVSPEPVQRPGVPLLLGGMSEASFKRVAEFGVGWTAGGLPPDMVTSAAEKVQQAWRDAGRDGEPRVVALAYFALGDVGDAARAYIHDYYGPMGAEMAEMIAGSVLSTPDAVKGAVDAFAAAGVDELYLDPAVSDPAQVDLLAEAVL